MVTRTGIFAGGNAVPNTALMIGGCRKAESQARRATRDGHTGHPVPGDRSVLSPAHVSVDGTLAMRGADDAGTWHRGYLGVYHVGSRLEDEEG
jgi:hypothetical protein